MNDGPEWKEVRSWFMRTMKSVGFASSEMSNYITEELEKALDNIKPDTVQKMKPIIVPAVINVLWIFSTGEPFSNDK